MSPGQRIFLLEYFTLTHQSELAADMNMLLLLELVSINSFSYMT